MKLLLRRDQKAGMLGMGKIAFTLDVRAELSEDEKQNVKKYKLGEMLLYEKKPYAEKDSILAIAGSVLAYKMLNLTISVNDLANGKRVEVKDVVEMLAVEDQIKEACRTFAAVLSAASSFGGEEIIEIA